ncbi:MAG TPA: hypothetical protein VHF89_09265 [Solirubrobacteraceae bacterium]|nr:hypothetical protein [Solirubrobacteraceae bacterium]
MARSAILTIAILLMTAAPALASGQGHDGGEGWYGLTNDKIVTNAGFILIAAFPLLIFLLSMLQHVLDKRKERRKKAAKARAGSPEWSGGW